MSEYKSIRGGKVKNYTTDPDNPYAGQVWFNETEGELRVRKNTLTSAWAAGGSLNSNRSYVGGAGTQTAGLAIGGNPATAITESYNGSSWTEVGDLNTARNQSASVGVDNTSALCFGGFSTAATAATEEWTGAGSPLTQTVTTD